MKSILEGILRNYPTLQPIYAFITKIFLAEKYFGKIKVQIYCSDPTWYSKHILHWGIKRAPLIHKNNFL